MTLARRAGCPLTADDWVQAGFAVLAEGGPNALRIGRLCERLEVTKGSFYWHFTDMRAYRTALADAWGSLYDERRQPVREPSSHRSAGPVGGDDAGAHAARPLGARACDAHLGDNRRCGSAKRPAKRRAGAVRSSTCVRRLRIRRGRGHAASSVLFAAGRGPATRGANAADAPAAVRERVPGSHASSIVRLGSRPVLRSSCCSR